MAFREIKLHHKLFLVLIGMLAMTAFGLLIAQDQETLRVRTDLAAEDPRFPLYLAHLLGRPLTTGDGYVVHTNGPDAIPAMLAAIEGAKSRISLETYIFRSDGTGQRFLDALERAARRGVTVRMVLDSVGSGEVNTGDVDRLEQAGAKVSWYHEVASFRVEEANYRTHRKILVADGRTAFIGGMGVADHWVSATDLGPAWRDTQVELRGPIVDYIEAAFNENWIETGGVVDPQLDITASPAGDGRSIAVWSSPQSGANDLKLMYLMAFAAARRTIDIESPYVITDSSTQWSLLQARMRGVRIRVLTEGDWTDAKPVKYAGRAGYDLLLRNGIAVGEYQPAMLHAKAVIIDGVLSIIGSANFDNRSLELNDELNVAAFDRGLAARLSADFERDFAAANVLELDRWRARPLTARAREQVWSLFGEVF